jgi:uncharacterized tellurite resistance protein B-like protein
MKRLTIRVEACTEILAILIVMAWADGKLLEREKRSVRDAANVLNLPKSMRDRIDALLERAPPLDQVLVENLGPKDRSYAYVAAAWMANVDEDVDPKETDKLDEVRERLGLDEARATELAAIARELGKPHEKEGWADDLVKLFKAIPPRLEADVDDQLEVAFE